MVLHQVMLHDDDWATTGTQIASADFLDDDGKIDEINGVSPVLRHVELFIRDTFAASITKSGWATLQMNNWPNTRRITVVGEILNAIITDSGSATASLPLQANIRYVRFPWSIPLKQGWDWVSDNSKIYAPQANADMQLLFSYSYGSPIPYKGGPILWIRKVADAAEAATDVWDEAWSDVLTGVAPGLDPDAQYILRGIGHEAGAAAKLGIGARAGPQQGAHKIIGPAGADNGIMLTVYLDDGIPITGKTGLQAWTAGGVADTPYVWLGFELVGGQLSPTGVIPAPTPIGAGPTTGGGLAGLLGNLTGMLR